MLAVEHALARAAVNAEGGLDHPALANLQTTQARHRLNKLKECVPAKQKRLQSVGGTWAKLVEGPRNCVPGPKRVDVPAINRAYFKMREIMLSCALDIPEKTVHLCEAPGGYVQAAYEDAPDSWQWRALTLASGPAPALPHDVMQHGSFVFADVLTAQRAVLCEEQGWAKLVTADGAVEMDHNRLEEEHFPLLLAQTQLGLECLAQGGDMVIKFFEGLVNCTQVWIALLTTRFAYVTIIKPNTSRPTNSERFLVCRGFSGDRSSLPATASVCDKWLHIVLWPVLERMALVQSEALVSAFAKVP